ncbi:phenylalanine--tRNA ligase subunit beta [Candidatus Peribacteria bacterium RIFCSPHIGHO2_02_FULL_53_20]|nr:MAG: phenylalanine--tRNA ligase subunit beta [Candidatus Peribacteria bacterium RIFCSPHIGHO2_02_FULL_53_20]
MKLSLHWLSDYVAFEIKDPEEIARRLTAHVGEVDEVEIQGKYLKDCCVGRVRNLRKHPNAEKLNLCEVETDKGVKNIVCGGTNLREGMLVAFAHVGATVRHGDEEIVLKEAKIRGEKSEGMICAAEELELDAVFPSRKEEGERPVVELKIENEKLKIGTPLREALGMDDVIFHIDNHAITHRADLFSHIGFARECIAIGIAKWKPDFAPTGLRRGPGLHFSKHALPFKFLVAEKELMPRYCACVIEVDSLGETPEWMKKRLQAVGWRSISLPVDITNFVASEVGVPLHSFDLDDLQGDVHMRKAKEGEKIVTLDGKEWKLPAGALILSDDEGVFDMLGIMGGLRSSTKPSTRRIYLHSASLDPVSIRATVIATGHRTDAATVYEKSVPHITTEQGFLRALELLLELAPGARVASKLESVGDNGAAKPIGFSVAYCEGRLGVAIPEKAIVKIFEDLGCSVEKGARTNPSIKLRTGGTGAQEDSPMLVTPPLWRLKDLKGAHDLAEEVGRIYGYDKIPVTLPEGSITPPARDHRIHHLRDALGALGYNELLPLSLISPDLVKKCNIDPERCVRVGNPIGEEVSLLQPCVMPQLLEHASRNMLFIDDALKTFHWGNIFTPNGQVLAFGALLGSRIETTPATEPFLRLKRDIVTALDHAGYAADLEPSKGQLNAVAHPGRSASITIAGKEVGSLFEVLPAVRERFDLPHRTAAVTINLDALFAIAPSQRHARSVPAYPAITYDVTMTLDRSKALQKILAKIRTSSLLLESVHVADIYSGKPLAKDQYNVTVRCTYRSPERTLTEEEVKKEHDKVLSITY